MVYKKKGASKIVKLASAKIEQHVQYMEGQWQGQRMLEGIEKTTYKSLDGAITAKQALIDNFENVFGFSRSMEIPDNNYAFNLGMLDFLLKAKEDEK